VAAPVVHCTQLSKEASPLPSPRSGVPNRVSVCGALAENTSTIKQQPNQTDTYPARTSHRHIHPAHRLQRAMSGPETQDHRVRPDVVLDCSCLSRVQAVPALTLPSKVYTSMEPDRETVEPPIRPERRHKQTATQTASPASLTS
jgi:hypothetical protein